MDVTEQNASSLPAPPPPGAFPWLEAWDGRLPMVWPEKVEGTLVLAEQFHPKLLRVVRTWEGGWIGEDVDDAPWIDVPSLPPQITRWPLADAQGVWGALLYVPAKDCFEVPQAMREFVASLLATFIAPPAAFEDYPKLDGPLVEADGWLQFFSEGGSLPLQAQRLRTIFPATGLTVLWQGNAYHLGQAPDTATVKALADQVSGQPLATSQRLQTTETFPDLAPYGGYAWAALSSASAEGIFWWRSRLEHPPRWWGPVSDKVSLPQCLPWQEREQKRLLEIRAALLDVLQMVFARQKTHFFEAGRQMFAELQQLSLVASKTSGGVIIADANWKVLWANDSLRTLLGFAPMSLVGHRPDWLFEGLFGALSDPALESLREGEVKVLRRECALETALEEARWTHVEVTPVRQSGEQVSEYIVILTDIHERHLAQEEVERQHVQLEETVDELREALERSRRLENEAHAAARAKTTFLATMSHEIRTPLNGIIGMASLMQGMDVSDEHHDYLQTIQTCGRTLADLINNILDFTKLDAGKVMLHSQPYDLEECIFTAFQAVDTAAQEKGLSVEIDFPPEVPAALMGDEVRLRQVFLNLLSNAVKFTEKGGITVRVRAQPILDEVLEFAVEVIDTGCGIPAEEHAELFDVFKQVDDGLNRRHEGSGLGLAICQAITTAMGGKLTLQSEPGVGTTFTLRWQSQVQDCQTITLPEADVPMTKMAPLKVLVVEDHEVNRLVLQRLLEREGHHVDVAHDAATALRFSSSQAYDVVFLDLVLPGRGGCAVAKEMRAQRQDWTPPLVAVTAHAGDDYRRKAAEAGIEVFVTKPLQPTDLQALWVQLKLATPPENLSSPEPTPSGDPFLLATSA